MTGPLSKTPLLPLLLLYGLMLPVTAMVPVLPDFTAQRFPGLGQFASHLFMSINMIGALVGAPIAGLLSDRLGRRKALAVTALAVNGLTLLGIAWAYQRADSYALLLGLRLFEGFAHMSALSLLMALGADQPGKAGLGARMGAVGAAISLGVATGAPLGGFVGGVDPLWVPLGGGLLSLALALAGALGLADSTHGRPRMAVGEIVHTLRSRRPLLVPLAFSFADRLTVGFIVSTLSLYLGLVIGFDARQIGLAMAAFLIPFSVLTYPAGHLSRHWDPLAMMVSGSVLYGVFLAVLGFLPGTLILPAMAVGGLIAALMYAPSLVLAAHYGGSDCRASALAAFNMAGSLGFATGPLLSSGLLAVFSLWLAAPYPAVFVAIGMIEVVLALVVLAMVRRGRLAEVGARA
ncbi:MFS transporter [Thauera sp.]|uniref:MFS transporter n=1 Tax=Thauera sp. TaxID=1905334 RepID=UPI002B81CD22|nr:MFS transporter [Thauera sp.]HRP23434.1 MFS transporter [Thauera sp.]